MLQPFMMGIDFIPFRQAQTCCTWQARAEALLLHAASARDGHTVATPPAWLGCVSGGCRKQFDAKGKLVDLPAAKPAASNGEAAMSTS